jgi:hypothetical protein
MTQDECLQVLGLEKGYSDEQLKIAYRNSALVWHPDRFQNQNEILKKRAEKEMQRVNEAFQALKSHSYTYSKAPSSPPPPRSASSPPPRPSTPPPSSAPHPPRYSTSPPPRAAAQPHPKEKTSTSSATPFRDDVKVPRLTLKNAEPGCRRRFYWVMALLLIISIRVLAGHNDDDPLILFPQLAMLGIISYSCFRYGFGELRRRRLQRLHKIEDYVKSRKI